MHRSTNVEEVSQAVRFDASAWLSNDKNIAISDNKGNVVLFEDELPGVVQGHYFFGSARGKEAVKLSHDVLELVFDKYDIHTVFALPLDDNKPAKWMCRRVGFKSYGTVKTPVGLCEKFILTKEEYNGRTG